MRERERDRERERERERKRERERRRGRMRERERERERLTIIRTPTKISARLCGPVLAVKSRWSSETWTGIILPFSFVLF